MVQIGTLSWSRGLVKSRQKNGRDSRSRETEVGEKIAVTSTHHISSVKMVAKFSGNLFVILFGAFCC